MKKPNRNHVPCRECGCIHQNPASSSLCSSCGAKERIKNIEQARQEEIERKERERNSLTTSEALEALIYVLLNNCESAEISRGLSDILSRYDESLAR